MTARYTIHQLTQATGVSRRTIRYYVQRGLIPAPEGSGRGHYYTDAHLARLQQVRALQAEGRSLDEIAVLLVQKDHDSAVVYSPSPALREAPAPSERSMPFGSALSAVPEPVDVEILTRLRIADGVELSFAAPARVPGPARLRAIVAAVARLLEN